MNKNFEDLAENGNGIESADLLGMRELVAANICDMCNICHQYMQQATIVLNVRLGNRETFIRHGLSHSTIRLHLHIAVRAV